MGCAGCSHKYPSGAARGIAAPTVTVRSRYRPPNVRRQTPVVPVVTPVVPAGTNIIEADTGTDEVLVIDKT